MFRLFQPTNPHAHEQEKALCGPTSAGEHLEHPTIDVDYVCSYGRDVLPGSSLCAFFSGVYQSYWCD